MRNVSYIIVIVYIVVIMIVGGVSFIVVISIHNYAAPLQDVSSCARPPSQYPCSSPLHPHDGPYKVRWRPSGLVWSGLVWSGLVWPGLAWPGLAWPGLAWPGLAWPGLAWPGLVWSGLVLVLNKMHEKGLSLEYEMDRHQRVNRTEVRRFSEGCKNRKTWLKYRKSIRVVG